MNTSTKPSNSPFVLVSSPGMHRMGDSIQRILTGHGAKLPHYKMRFERFSNGEMLPIIKETVRNQHVFFLHAMQHPDPNTAVMEMLLTNDGLRRASVSGITLVVPYIPYLRQDRKDQPHVPISARMIADLIESNRSVKQIITVDMHSEQAQGFLSVPVDNLTSASLFAKHFIQQLGAKILGAVAVAPDFGGAVRTRRFAEKLGGLHVAIIEKKRNGPNESEILSLVGDPKVINGAETITFEDMIDTGGTIRKAATALQAMGASAVHLSATHGIFSGNATANFAESGLRVTCTDSIPRSAEFLMANQWLNVVSIDNMLAKAIFESSLIGGSISETDL